MSSKRFKKVNNYSVKFTPHIIFDNIQCQMILNKSKYLIEGNEK